MSIPTTPPPLSPQACAAAEARPAAPVAASPRSWTSAELLGPHREVLIDHQGACYRLRLTALGKLILTK